MNLLSALLHGRIGLRVKNKNPQTLEDGTLIPEGALGITKSATCAGAIVGVRWDGRDDEHDARFDQLEVLDQGAS